jgi:hypothetical protein
VKGCSIWNPAIFLRSDAICIGDADHRQEILIGFVHLAVIVVVVVVEVTEIV